MSRQFTDGEIVAAISALATEGKALTRAAVRARLGGGGSTRISAILKDYDGGADGTPPTRSGPDLGNDVRSGPKRSGPASERSSARQDVTARLVVPASPPAGPGPAPGVGDFRLQSEIRVLKILLEEERNARREDEARHRRTIEALQQEIETANRGRS